MRCLIVIALCFVLANAYNPTKNRFQRLLNQYQDQDRHQNQHRNRYQTQDRLGNELYGSDDTDDYIDDYVDEIRRERMLERDQCPRDIDEIEGQFQDDQYDDEEIRGGRYNQDYEREGRRGNRYSEESEYEREDERRGQYSQYEDEEESRIRGSPLLQEVEEANVRLAARLYKQSKDEKDDKNTVVSPLSIQLALAALNSGARGNTKRQIGRVIAGRLQKQQRKQIFKKLIRHLKGLRQNEYSSRQQTTKINAVTGIFVTKTTRAQHMFVQQVKRNLGANVHQCNFQRQPQQCRQQINRFVAQKTQGKITHIVPQDAITDNTKMILVNALQLKAPFGRQVRQHLNTKGAKFYPLDTKKVKHVEVIETQGRFKYYEDELVKIVGLPTEKKQLTLYVIVPKDKDGLNDVEKLHLQDGVQLKQLLDVTDQQTRHVDVQLPKFQIKHKIDVRRTLRKQGVTDAFDAQRADFSGITGQHEKNYEDDEESSRYERSQWSQRRNPFLNYEQDETMEYTGQQEQEQKLHLNKFIHQTTIKITEQGITASTGSQSPFENDDEQTEGIFGRQGRRHHRGEYESEEEEYNTFDEITGFNRREQSGQRMVKANRAFAFVVKHNPTNQLVMVGRVIDAAQKKVNEVHQTINNVDQL
jgi:serpin B